MSDNRGAGWIGTILNDRWKVEEKIARGGVATVYKAADLHTHQKVAVKIMHPEFARNQDALGRFLREGYVANKVGHALVVQVIADGKSADGTAFMVMELLEKGELLETKRERLGGKLPPEEVVAIGDQVLDVLVAAHTQDIVHRDIKPENLFVLEDGTVKVLDFGIAHIKESVMKAESTATGLLLGTPDFMSPEQAMGMRGTIDAASDIYALGATMFTLLSGEAVHTDQSLAGLLHSTSTKQARSLGAVKNAASIPQTLIAVIDKSLMLQKTQRWPSARAFQNALRQALPAQSRVPESAKTRPFNPLDLAPIALAPSHSVRQTGKAPLPSATPRDGVRAPSLPPMSEEPPTPREAQSPWETEFEDGELEDGPTVSTNELPSLVALAKRAAAEKERPVTSAMVRPKLPAQPMHPDVTPDLDTDKLSNLDIHTTQNMTGELLAGFVPTRPAAPVPPPQPPPHASIPPPAPAQFHQTGPFQHLGAQPHQASMPPPPPQHHASIPPPQAHGGSIPPPQPYYSQPPPAPYATPRGQVWNTSDSGGIAIAPSIPPPLVAQPLGSTRAQSPKIDRPADKSKTKKKASPPKPPSIVIAEIVLAVLVVITLTIGGCLLLQSR